MKLFRIFALILIGSALFAMAGCSGSGSDDSDCNCSSNPTIEEDGLVFTFEKQTVRSPSNVYVLFKLEDENGEPVANLDAGNFEIFEDGELISEYESQQAIMPKPGNYVHYTLLLLDLSGSILKDSNKLDELKSAARTFADNVMPESDSNKVGEIRMGIWWFDGAASPHNLVSFTDDKDDILPRISSINEDISNDSSTNLYGSIIRSVEEVEDAVKGFDGTASGSLIIFTDGQDQAARKTRDEAVNAVGSADERLAVYTIALGDEADDELLEILGKDGFYSAEETTDLVPKFEAIAQDIQNNVNSHYLLEYCSPKRKGSHDLTIQVEISGGKSGALTSCFCASGFRGGCTISDE